MSNDFGTGKSVLILAIVAGCFAILWPNLFYPMITGSYNIQKNEAYSGGCCDVIFDNDINAIRIMSGLCEKILASDATLDSKSLISFEEGKITREILDKCQTSVLEKCNLNITDIIRRNALLGKSYRQNLDLVRTLNSSICLRESFGIPIGQIGLPRRMRIWGVNMSKHLKQERPSHLHPEMMHPALREKGRAIPQSHIVPKLIQEARPRPLPGMRPPMGGPGHVVPPPKVGTGGTMSIVMPMYTIGIVVFFLYTIMKIMFKKPSESSNYDDFTSDPDFRNEVFTPNSYSLNSPKEKKHDEPTRLVVTAISGLVQQVSKETYSAQSDEGCHCQEIPSPSTAETSEMPSSVSEQETEEASKIEEEEVNRGVKVVGMEITESCEGGKWSGSQVLPRPPTPQAVPRPPTPQSIYLPAVISDQSQLLVTDSTTEAVPDSENAIVLSGKVTLSLIGIQDTDESVETRIADSKQELETDGEAVDIQRVPESGDDFAMDDYERESCLADSDDNSSGCEEDHDYRDSLDESEEEIGPEMLNTDLENEFFDPQENESIEQNNKNKH